MKKQLYALLTAGILVGLVSCGGDSTSLTTETSLTTNNNSETTSETTYEPVKDDDKVHIIVLTGQSGARGKAVNADLTDEEAAENPDVKIFADGLMMPALNAIPTHPDYQTKLLNVKGGFGDSGGEFGPEIGIAQTMASRYGGGDHYRAVIVKYTASGSTFYNHWMSESAVADESLDLDRTNVRTNETINKKVGPLTNNLYQLIDLATSAISEDGYEYAFDGVVFCHGEQDTKYDANMAVYEKCLDYFVTDLSSYLGNTKVPFVITEALTNSGKYCNDLRTIQKSVSEKHDNAYFMSTSDLNTNTFEPWHFGAKSNIILGNRCAAEIIKHFDNRNVTELLPETNLTIGKNDNTAKLPEYMKAKFDNETDGYVPVSWGNLDLNSKGTKTVNVVAHSNNKDFTGKVSLKVIDTNADGYLNEPYWKTAKTYDLPYGKVMFSQSDSGLGIGFSFEDEDGVYTDGESWNAGDMGQIGQNDDLEIYVALDQDASSSMVLAISSASLLRVYQPGTNLEANNLSGLPAKNMLYKKLIEDYAYHSHTHGDVNTNDTNTWNGELYISWGDLGAGDASNVSVCCRYTNVTIANNEKKYNYQYKDGLAEGAQKIADSYTALSDLL